MIEHRNTEDVKAMIQEWQTFRFFFGSMCDFGFALFLDLLFWKDDLCRRCSLACREIFLRTFVTKSEDLIYSVLKVF
jgi:hypothetical protein